MSWSEKSISINKSNKWNPLSLVLVCCKIDALIFSNDSFHQAILVMCEHTVCKSSHVVIQKKDLKTQYYPEGTTGWLDELVHASSAAVVLFLSRNILNVGVLTNLGNVCWRFCPLPSTSLADLHTQCHCSTITLTSLYWIVTFLPLDGNEISSSLIIFCGVTSHNFRANQLEFFKSLSSLGPELVLV